MNKQEKDKFFNELMADAYDKVYTFVGRGCKDREFVEDVVQETFYEAYRNIGIMILRIRLSTGTRRSNWRRR